MRLKKVNKVDQKLFTDRAETGSKVSFHSSRLCMHDHESASNVIEATGEINTKGCGNSEVGIRRRQRPWQKGRAPEALTMTLASALR